MKLFKDLYRIPSSRLQNWDYARASCYFVTVCVKGHACSLADIVEGEVKLSQVGYIVAEEWQRTPHVRPNVELDAWQIMPNHLHAILVIKDVGTARHAAVETPRWGVSGQVVTSQGVSRRGVSTETFQRNDSTKRPRLKPGSLGSIIGQFKSASTRQIRAAVAVNPSLVRRYLELFHGASHREQACVQDIEAVDLLDCGARYRKCNGALLNKYSENFPA